MHKHWGGPWVLCHSLFGDILICFHGDSICLIEDERHQADTRCILNMHDIKYGKGNIRGESEGLGCTYLDRWSGHLALRKK